LKDTLQLNFDKVKFIHEDERAETLSAKIITKFYYYCLQAENPIEAFNTYLQSNKFTEKKAKMDEYYREYTEKVNNAILIYFSV